LKASPKLSSKIKVNKVYFENTILCNSAPYNIEIFQKYFKNISTKKFYKSCEICLQYFWDSSGITKCPRFLHLKPYRKIAERLLENICNLSEILPKDFWNSWSDKFLDQIKQNCIFKIHFYLFFILDCLEIQFESSTSRNHLIKTQKIMLRLLFYPV